MATPTPGTFPSFPPYQPGALQYSGSEIFLLVTSATATAAATYYDLVNNAIGKAIPTLTNVNPTANDVIAIYQQSTQLPRSVSLGNLGVVAGNVPIGGTQGQGLFKNSSTNYDASWYSLSTFLVAGTGVTLSGSTTVTIALSGGTFGGLASPTATIGLVVVNGVATTAMRSDAAPPLSQAIAPTWSGQHTFATTTIFNTKIAIGSSGPDPTAVINILGSGGTSGFLVFGNPTNPGNAYVGIGYDQTNDGIGFYGAFGLSTLNRQLMFLSRNTGALGIGTTNPSATLTVVGTASISGTTSLAVPLGVPSGGTNTSTLTANGVLYGNGSSTVGITAAGATGALLSSNGTAPLFNANAFLGNGLALGTTTDPGLGNLSVLNFINSISGFKRVTTNTGVVSTTTLQNVSGLAVTISTGANYFFEGILYLTAGSTGGSQVAISAANISSIIYDAQSCAAGVLVAQGRATSAGIAIATSTAALTPTIHIVGTLASGTSTLLTPQIAQAAATTTTTVVLAGSTFQVYQIN